MLGSDGLNSKEKILTQAKTLFAEKGFSGVSMRNLANKVNMSVASIYHHFPDKNSLYLETVQFAFQDKAVVFSAIWQGKSPAEQKLALFVNALIQELAKDREFHCLIQRELVDANPVRMEMLAKDVFHEEFSFLLNVMKEITPERDAHLAAISVLSLCKHHFEMQPIRCFLPDWKPEHEEPHVIANQVMKILLEGIL